MVEIIGWMDQKSISHHEMKPWEAIVCWYLQGSDAYGSDRVVARMVKLRVAELGLAFQKAVSEESHQGGILGHPTRPPNSAGKTVFRFWNLQCMHQKGSPDFVPIGLSGHKADEHYWPEAAQHFFRGQTQTDLIA